MEIHNLGAFVREGAFLQWSQPLPFDAILWEKIPTDIPWTIHNTKNLPIEHETFAHLGYDMKPQGSIVSWIKGYKHVLLVLDSLDTKTIQPILSALPVSTIVAIRNIGAGVTWLIQKHTLDNHDIQVMAPYFPVYEPVDLYHLMRLAQLDTNAYVRVPQDDLPEKLFDGDHDTLYEQHIVSLQEFGYTGTRGLVVTLPWLLPVVTQALQYLQKQYGYGYDLHVLFLIGETISPQVKELLSQADSVYLLHDQGDNLAFQEWLDIIMKQNPYHTKIVYHHPNYEHTTTFLPWYMFTQADFDAEQIAQWLYAQS